MPTLVTPSLQLDTSADTTEKRDHVGLVGWTSPGALVQLLQDGVKLVSVTANAIGRFDYQLASWPSFGHHTFSAVASDAAGQSATSKLLEVDLDNQPPAVPTLGSSYINAAGGLHYIRAEGSYLTGMATPAATVRILSNGEPYLTARADAQGFWHLALPKLDDGAYNFSATATTNMGTSNTSATWIVATDSHAPDTPKLFFGNGSHNVLSSDWAAFSGSAEGGSQLELILNGVVRGRTTVRIDGIWFLNVELEVGTYQASVRVTDAALNQSAPSLPVNFTVSPAQDAPANADTTARLAIGGSAQGMIEHFGDHDWYRVTLEANKLYQFTLTAAESTAGTLNMSTSGIWEDFLHLWDSQRSSEPVQVGQTTSIGFGKPVVLTFAAQRAGDYFLDMGANYAVGSYTLSAVKLASDDHANDNQYATALPLNQKLDGQIDYAGDVDRFALNLKAGVSYTVTLDSAGAPYGAAFRQLTLTGGPTAHSSGSSSSWDGVVQLSLVPSQDGIYYLSASGGNGDSVPYHIVLNVAADDYLASSATTGRVLPDALAHGTLESSADADWFKATLSADTSYLLQALDPQRNALTLEVFDASGNPIPLAGSVVFGADAMLWKAPASGDYFFQVTGNVTRSDYTLRVTPQPADDFGASIASAGGLTPGAGVSGALEVPQDADWFKVALNAGSDYVFVLDSSKAGHTLQSGGQLQLLDSAGQSLLQTQGGGTGSSAQLVFHASKTANYYLVLSDPLQRHTGSYGITMIASNQDNASANTSTSATLAPNQVKQNAIDYATDVDWYRVDMKAQHWYHFELTGVGGRGGTLPSGGMTLNLVDASGHPIQYQTSSYFNDPTLSFYPQSDTTYYLAVSAQNNATGSYTLKARLDYEAFPDTLPPLYKTMVTPLAGSVLERGPLLIVYFDEVVKLGSGTITLRLASGELVESFSAAAGNASLPAGFSSLSLNSKLLTYATDYVLTLAPDSVTDYSKHPFAGTSLSFRTPDSPPRQDGDVGNNLLRSISNNDILDGKSGLDSAIIPGVAGVNSILKVGELITIDGYAGFGIAPQRHTLLNIERLLFDDRAIAYDIDGNAGKAYRLYQAAFDRRPDLDGLGFWIAQLDQNTTLDSVARGFIQSSEFIARYGSAPSDQEFVAGLYQNVLHRQPDQGGVDFWNSKLHDGISRSEVLMAFSESPENQAALIGKIGNGISYHLYG